MSERLNVESPFLAQLSALGWHVVDQGEALPTEPEASHRASFREVALKKIFFNSVRAINLDERGRPWLTDVQFEFLFTFVTTRQGSLVEANQAVHEALLHGIPDIDHVTDSGVVKRTARLVDFDRPEANHFIAINQFRVDTPGQAKAHIRPDLVLFVNGLPLVVVEAKEANSFTSIPLEEAKKQLLRYSERRDDSTKGGVREGEERLFHFNLFSVATTGSQAVYGSITAEPDEFQSWRSIEPAKYQTYKVPLGGPPRAQEVLVQGMLPKETLLDLLQNFCLFSTKRDKLVKVMCRYQQYRAVLKALARIRANRGDARGGVIWHTQGSGKSLTMVFFVRKLRMSKDLFDLKVILVNDRTDLEDQLEGTAHLAGEPVTTIDSAQDLKSRLLGGDSGLYLVMVHKFREAAAQLPQSVKAALGIPIAAPRLNPFPEVNKSSRIIIFIDEAHRTQYADLGNNLAVAFPNAIKIAFTGTPLITSRHQQTTAQRFGSYIDTYKLKDAQEDGAVLPIVYVGKTTDTALSHKSEFDEKFEDLFSGRTAEEIDAIKKKYGTRDDILEAEARVAEVAKDLVKHYIENVMPDGFKAQVVSASKVAALRYKASVDKAIATYAERYAARPGADPEVLRLIRFLKAAVVVSVDGTNELAGVLEARKEAKELDAVANFLKRFDLDKPETGVAFLIVCDMLLTGFDAPIEQVMYLDKPLREHTLLQAVARVNRTAPGKKVGLIVDYIGLTKHLREALNIYAGDDLDDILQGMHSMDGEFAKLEGTFARLVYFFREHKIPQAEDWARQSLPAADEYLVFELMLDLLEDAQQRETFSVLLMLFLQALNIVLPAPAATEYLMPAKRLAWLKAQARERFKDEGMSFGNAGEKIKRLINEHLVSLGVNPKVPPVELLSAQFMKAAGTRESPKAKASEMEHALRKHITVHMDEDPAWFGTLSEKLEELLRKYQDDWSEQARQLQLLVQEAQAGRSKSPSDGVDTKAVPFYEVLIKAVEATVKLQPDEKQALKSFSNDLIPVLRVELNTPGFWGNADRVSSLQGLIGDRLVDTGVGIVVDRYEGLANDLVQLAKARQLDLLA
ncbi:type I restriction endonuclease subunit R [Variovorax guangxiensis]|uniref:Type I restriction enzyme endonuclease subunit n=1 Tax=Variovorax guangxiensis TaxID=1775474 RepID=A0A502DV48_9BURK|nr:type I restriction endonuclease subunit R [Variovorax guangxiensis]TPG24951.1 type I restriction endonuclease subunit R [Variovorax ginsengisoli]TPG29203.1 type I restriction endonuclease subunit R [Variovorax guangxiensis]